MKKIKQITQKIADKDQQITLIRNDLDRCNQAIASADQFDGALNVLRERRSVLLAEAFITSTTADASELDSQIRDTEIASANARLAGTSATAALSIVQERLTNEIAARACLTDELNQSVIETMREQFIEAEEKYAQAAESINNALYQMSAVGCVISMFGGKSGFIEHAEAYRRQLRDAGLTIPTPHAATAMGRPGWLYGHLGATETQDLLTCLRENGVAI